MDILEMKSHDWGNVLSPWVGADLSIWKKLTEGRAVREYDAGDEIFTHGAPHDNAYIIKDGRARISVMSSEGEEKHIFIACPGAVIGEPSCILSLPHIATATAIVSCSVYSVPSKEVQKLFHSDAHFADHLLQFEARKYYMMISQQATLAFDSAEARIAKTLLCLCDTYGISDKQGIKIGIKVTCEDIAGIVSTSRVTANTIMMDLRRRDLLDKKDGRYLIRDIDTLQSIAENNFAFIHSK